MAAIAVQDLNAAGSVLDVTFSAANAGGDTVVAGNKAGGYGLGTVVLLFKNGHSADQTATVDGVAHILPFGATKVAAIPVARGAYGPNTNVAITYSGVTALTVGAVRL